MLTSLTERRMFVDVTKVFSKTRNTENGHKIESDLCERKTGCKLELNRALLLCALWIGSAEG